MSVPLAAPVPPAAGDAAPDDDQLVARTRAGDRAAFALLVERHQGMVYALAHRMLGSAADAEDAAQETFVRAYTRLGTYQPGGKFGAWLAAICAHWCIDHLRRTRAVPLDTVATGPGALSVGERQQPEALALRAERRMEVRDWLARLPAPYRRVLVLRYWHELSYAEIGRALGEPVSTVRMRLFRARKALSDADPNRMRA